MILSHEYPFIIVLSIRIKELINVQLDESCTKHMQNMAVRMGLKFDKYCDECDLLLSLGAILDPRYKKKIIKFAYESMYPIDYESRIETVPRCFNDLYDQYEKIYGDEKKERS
ncbi:hypothetical protein LIER_16030 [Lithospermum erythrorhizon]|uniref:hAT-like transposase RNase-H fold domain-containing protein n=1 Tax=Lithospermum erythrorhizon TaxID=34254 RepID=A0AAV3Q6Q1_LITER